MPSLNSYIIGILMLIAYSTALFLTPEVDKSVENTVDLEAMIPLEFGQWKIDMVSTMQSIQGINAGQSDIIYSQVLSRVYQNERGQRIMFLIAYGSNQSDSLSVHKPEGCYPAQGFQIINKQKIDLELPEKIIPAVRLVAQKHSRTEPITYWIVTGNKVVSGNLDTKFIQFKYAITGTVPDGFLVRVSSIDKNTKRAFNLQEKFISELHDSLSRNSEKLFGEENES